MKNGLSLFSVITAIVLINLVIVAVFHYEKEEKVEVQQDNSEYQITCVDGNGAVWFDRRIENLKLLNGGYLFTYKGLKQTATGSCLTEEIITR